MFSIETLFPGDLAVLRSGKSLSSSSRILLRLALPYSGSKNCTLRVEGGSEINGLMDDKDPFEKRDDAEDDTEIDETFEVVDLGESGTDEGIVDEEVKVTVFEDKSGSSKIDNDSGPACVLSQLLMEVHDGSCGRYS